MKTKTNVLLLLAIIALSLTNCAPKGTSVNQDREFNSVYKGPNLDRIAFPIGGIGAGMICLEGTGAISHVSVYNKPDIFNEPAIFAAISVKGVENGAKVLEGQVPDFKVFGRPNTGNGAPRATYGLPRFESADFETHFPFGKINLKDGDIPLDVSITGWSPFIPLDADNSSLPCGALEYTFENTGNKDVEAVFSFNSVNFMIQPNCENSIKPFANGFILSNQPSEDNPEMKGDFAIFSDNNETLVDHCWFRGTWYDPLSITWKSISSSEPRVVDPVEKDAPGASLYVPFSLKPGEKKTVKLMLSWYSPNTLLRSGGEVHPEEEKCDPNTGCCESQFYQPWYISKFKNINDVANYWLSNYDDLRNQSELFSESFYNTSLPDAVVEAVAANLTILKSPTVLRQPDGRIWSWEGCKDDRGCCSGSCTHVWNYAQAIPHLFPSLERTLRETEFFVSQNDIGHQVFRTSIPIRESVHKFYAAADGQLGGIMKVYREWRISGNDEWLNNIYPKVKSSLDFCIQTWDPRETGSLEEPHHNTYDVEFWGPDGMCTSFYLGALKAFIEMGEYLKEDVSHYQGLLDKGKKVMEDVLYNGEYFNQIIKTEGLNAKSPIEEAKHSMRSTYSEEAVAILKKEGPKYQYGNGCLSDGILGLWIAKVCGLDDEIIDNDLVLSHLESVYKYNFKPDLSDHPNPQRPTFAMKDDGGLLLCSWPHDDALSLPFVYSNEVWTGIEYQVASHLMFFGKENEALDIVEACRQRYDGTVRNPFNEYECGHWYARAMSSYGLIQGLTGVRYDAVTKTLYIDSQIGEDFNSFFSCQTGYGNIGLVKGKPFVKMVKGLLKVEVCIVSGEKIELSELDFIK
jgi:uncharacterized protein (DUF608 family)